MLASAAAPRQCLRVVHGAIRPYITYALLVALYTTPEYDRLDGLLRRLAKGAFGLPVSFPSAAVHGYRDKWGLRLESLYIQYAQICAKTLVDLTHSTGALGAVTPRLLKMQMKHMGAHQPLSCHFWQLSVCEGAGLEVAKTRMQ